MPDQDLRNSERSINKKILCHSNRYQCGTWFYTTTEQKEILCAVFYVV